MITKPKYKFSSANISIWWKSQLKGHGKQYLTEERLSWTFSYLLKLNIGFFVFLYLWWTVESYFVELWFCLQVKINGWNICVQHYKGWWQQLWIFQILFFIELEDGIWTELKGLRFIYTNCVKGNFVIESFVVTIGSATTTKSSKSWNKNVPITEASLSCLSVTGREKKSTEWDG